MKSFTSKDSFKVSGRGLVKCVHIANPKREKRPPGTPSMGEHVIVDGIEYEVTGVEVAMKLVDPPFASESVLLVVKETP